MLTASGFHLRKCFYETAADTRCFTAKFLVVVFKFCNAAAHFFGDFLGLFLQISGGFLRLFA